MNEENNTIPFIWDTFSGIGAFDGNAALQGVREQQSGNNDPFPEGEFAKMNKAGISGPLKVGKPEIMPDKTSYTVYVKVLQDGSGVLDAYEAAKPGERDIIFFCEKTDTTRSNLFGTFILVKYGAKYRSLIWELMEGKTHVASRKPNSSEAFVLDSFEDEVTDNCRILKMYGVQATHEKITSVMEGEYRRTDNSVQTLNGIYDWYNDGLHKIIDGVNGWLEEVKFDSEDYRPKNQNQASETAKQIIAAGQLFLGPIEDFISRAFQTAYDTVKHFAEKVLPDSWIAFLERMYSRVQSILSGFKDTLAAMAGIVGEAYLLMRALLMGFVNGLLSTIQLLVSLIGWILQTNAHNAVNGKVWRQMNSAFEFIEDMYDLAAKNVTDLFAGIKNLVVNFSLEKLQSVLHLFTGKISQYDRYDYAFFAGSFLFEVVLSVILAVFTGGASAIAQATTKATKILETLKLVGREVISEATLGIVDALQLLRMILKKFIEACKKGWEGMKEFFENLIGQKKEELSEEDLPGPVIIKRRHKRRITIETMRQEMPQDFLEALIQLGQKEKDILKYYTDYHNDNGFEFLDEVTRLLVKFPELTKTDVFLLWGYTTKSFYKPMNELLRNRMDPHKTGQIAKMLTEALGKMPTYSGTAYRTLPLTGSDLDVFLSEHQPGSEVLYSEFLSCGSTKGAAFFDKEDATIFITLEVKNAPVISEFADGIKYRGYQREELLLLTGRRFEVKEYIAAGDRHYLTLTEL